MSKRTITINSIFDGISQASMSSEKDQYLAAIAIDPDVPETDSAIKTAGVIRPVGYFRFNASLLDQPPLWIVTNPKNTKTYVYCNAGDLLSYDSSMASETLERAVSSSTGNGFAYYNNYLYYARNTDIGRYGPLNGSPSFNDVFWGTTLGLTALTNTTYPSTRNSVLYPNHPMHVHVDNKLYFGDFRDGKGIISYIKTSKTTDEGDTNNGSTSGALDLPFGYMPTALASYSNFLVIAASQTSNSTVNQGPSALFFWDTTSTSFTRVVNLPDPLCSALRYQNGVLYIWSGNLQGGVRFSRYVGGDFIQTLKFLEEGHPPLAGAVESYGNRVMWGGFTTYPENTASVYAYGSKSDLFPRGLHNIARTSVTASATNGVVTALKNVLQTNGSIPEFIIGSTDGTTPTLDKRTTAFYGSNPQVWRSKVFNVGQSFKVNRIKLRFAQSVGANMTLIPKLFFDNETSSQVGTTINNTNYANSEKFVTMTSDNFSNTVAAKNNFFLELRWSGNSLLSVLLPITIEIELYDNDSF